MKSSVFLKITALVVAFAFTVTGLGIEKAYSLSPELSFTTPEFQTEAAFSLGSATAKKIVGLIRDYFNSSSGKSLSFTNITELIDEKIFRKEEISGLDLVNIRKTEMDGSVVQVLIPLEGGLVLRIFFPPASPVLPEGMTIAKTFDDEISQLKKNAELDIQLLAPMDSLTAVKKAVLAGQEVSVPAKVSAEKITYKQGKIVKTLKTLLMVVFLAVMAQFGVPVQAGERPAPGANAASVQKPARIDEERMQGLIQELGKKGYGSSSARKAAAMTLCKVGDERAVPALIKALEGDPESDRNYWPPRFLAARALGKIGDARAVPALIKTMNNDYNSQVCRVAAVALGEIGNEECIAALIKAMDLKFPEDRPNPYKPPKYRIFEPGTSEQFRAESAFAERMYEEHLGKIIFNNLDGAPWGGDIDETASYALLRMGSRAIYPLAREWSSRDEKDRGLFTQTLRMMGARSAMGEEFRTGKYGGTNNPIIWKELDDAYARGERDKVKKIKEYLKAEERWTFDIWEKERFKERLIWYLKYPGVGGTLTLFILLYVMAKTRKKNGRENDKKNKKKVPFGNKYAFNPRYFPDPMTYPSESQKKPEPSVTAVKETPVPLRIGPDAKVDLPPGEKISLNDIVRISKARNSLADKMARKRAFLRNVMEYIDGEESFLRSFIDEKTPVKFRVPVELLRDRGRRTARGWWGEVSRHPNIHVELYSSSHPDRAIKDVRVYGRHGIQMKTSPFGASTRTNTVTIVAVEMKIDNKKAVQDIMQTDETSQRSIVVPAAAWESQTWAIRTMFLGLRLIRIARNPEDIQFINETVSKYSAFMSDSLEDREKVTADDIKTMAFGGTINDLVHVIMKIVETLPLQRMSIKDVKEIYERALSILQAA